LKQVAVWKQHVMQDQWRQVSLLCSFEPHLSLGVRLLTAAL